MDGRWPAMIVIIVIVIEVSMWSSNYIGEGGDVPTVLLAALRGHSKALVAIVYVHTTHFWCA